MRGPIRVTVAQGDITTFDGDAIVNAANNHLVLGSGVAGAIARRGGPAIQRECDRHGPIRVGEAARTGAGDLTARFVIHAAAMGDEPVTEQSITSATTASLEIADTSGVERLAVPVLGSGVGGFDFDTAAQLMMDCIEGFATHATALREVVFFGFSASDAARLAELINDRP
jgi:O-acetyl-ADP-ribose deacetylase (regulator of RNase III)